MLLVAGGCDLDMPGVPLWVVEATFPFNQRVYRMSELVTDSAEFARNGWGLLVNETDSVLRFEYREDLEYQRIGDRLTYEASRQGRYTNQIGIIYIEEPFPEGDTITITEANPELFAGYEGPVPPFELQQARDTLNFNIFHWIRIHSGWVYLTVLNQYPFDLQDVTLSLINVPDREPVGRITFLETIPAGESAVDSIDITGKLVYNELVLEVDGRSPGTQDSVRVSGDEHMAIVVRISDTEVDSANAQVAEQQFSKPHRLRIDNPNKIVQATIKRGSATFNLTNTTRFRLFVTMTFENIIDENGDPLSEFVRMDPLTYGSPKVVDLDGYTLIMDLADQELRVFNEVTVEDSRETNFEGTSYQTIAGYQGVEIEYRTGDLTLHSITGVLDSVRVDIPEQSTPIDVPEGLDNLDFTADTLFVYIDNGTSMPLRLDFDVEGRNNSTRRSVVIPVEADLMPGPNTVAVPDVDNLTEVLPDEIRVTGWAGLGTYFFPDFSDSVGTISEDHGFSGEVRLKSGLKLTIGGTRFITDVTEIDESFEHKLQSVEVLVSLTNCTPLGGMVKLLMGNDSTRMDTIAGITIPRRIVEHRATPVDTLLTILLDRPQLDILRHSPIYTRQVLELSSTEGDTIWLDSRDSLAVQASATAYYLIDAKGDDDE